MQARSWHCELAIMHGGSVSPPLYLRNPCICTASLFASKRGSVRARQTFNTSDPEHVYMVRPARDLRSRRSAGCDRYRAGCAPAGSADNAALAAHSESSKPASSKKASFCSCAVRSHATQLEPGTVCGLPCARQNSCATLRECARLRLQALWPAAPTYLITESAEAHDSGTAV